MRPQKQFGACIHCLMANNGLFVLIEFTECVHIFLFGAKYQYNLIQSWMKIDVSLGGLNNAQSLFFTPCLLHYEDLKFPVAS